MAETVGLSARIRRHILDVELQLPLTAAGSPVTVLFGPSGAGKTTLLRCLAGLDRPDRGRIEVGGEVWDDGRSFVPPRRRRVGYLFQEHALFPHLSVDANVGYGLRHLPRKTRPARVAQVLATAGADHLAGRPVRQLSGGEAQRVALARALAPAPRLLLLDEPLSALDAPTRARLRVELRRVLVAAGVPSIVVTHDRTEALALGDRIVVLIDGRVAQVDDLPDGFARPAGPAVAAAVGVESTLPGRVVEVAGGLARVRVGRHTLQAASSGVVVDDEVLACIRAEEVALAPAAPEPPPAASPRNRLPATVTALATDGPLLRVDLDCDGVPLVAYVTRLSGEDLALRTGAPVVAVVKATAVHLVPR
jgi:molybdate transport system ATP-binding protein